MIPFSLESQWTLYLGVGMQRWPAAEPITMEKHSENMRHDGVFSALFHLRGVIGWACAR